MKNRIHILAVFALLAVGALLVRVDRVQAAAGDSNYTNIVATGDIAAGDDVTVGDDLTVTDKVTAPKIAIGVTPELFAVYSKTLVSGAKTFNVSAEGMTDVDMCICGRIGNGSGGTPDIECSASGTVVSVADGSGSSTSVVSCVVFGSP